MPQPRPRKPRSMEDDPRSQLEKLAGDAVLTPLPALTSHDGPEAGQRFRGALESAVSLDGERVYRCWFVFTDPELVPRVQRILDALQEPERTES